MKQARRRNAVVRLVIWMLSGVVLLQPIKAAIAEDQGIVSDPVQGIYRGAMLGDTIRHNLNFSDLPANHWAKEAVCRLGALNIVQGYQDGGRYRYRPNQNVSKEEALALLIRAIGKEAQAKEAAARLGTDEEGQSNLTFWSKGYLSLAQELGAISRDQLNQALSADEAGLSPDTFQRTGPARREEVAMWLVKLAAAAGSADLGPQYENQAIFAYGDWLSIGPDYLPYVEMVTRAGIMKGDGNLFSPQKGISRAEMAQTIRNMGQTLYDLRGISMKNGYIGHIDDKTSWNNQTSKKERNYLVRDEKGQVDQWIYGEEINSDQVKKTFSAPVFWNGNLSNLLALKEGDQVEYLVDDRGTLFYVSAKEGLAPSSFSASLQPFTDLANGQISLKDGDNTYHFTMAPSIYRQDPAAVAIKLQSSNRFVPLGDLPYSHRVTVTVKDKLVTEIFYQGDIIRTNEISGLIKDINSDFKYIVIETWDGKIINMKYRTANLVVEKRPYYENEVNTGYFDEIFRHYHFDPYDGKIEDLEIGDVVHALVSEEDAQYLSRISARTNYVMDLGQIIEVRAMGDLGSRISLRRRDNSIATYQVAPLAGVFYGEERSGLAALKAGQNVKLLINQAVVEAGSLREVVKEIVIDKLGNQVANIYKGNIGLVNLAQKQVTLNHSYQLQHSRWDDYQASRVLEQNEKTKYYYNGQRVSADYVSKYLYSPNIIGYGVTTQFFSGEMLDTLSFRDSRETMLDRDRVEEVAGGQQFSLEDRPGIISADEGTIILKDNHVVSFASLLPPDYTRVILNGQNKAALIEVSPEPGNDSLQIFRGRIAKIDEMKSFKVQSNSSLKGMNWTYSPIKREFELDYRSQIYSGGKWIKQADFLSYSELSQTDKVYHIIADGTKARYVLDQPYLQEGVRGTIYGFDDKGIKIKDVFVYQKDKKKWEPLSLTNSYALISPDPSALFFRQNQPTDGDSLKVGEVIRVMTTEDLSKKLKANRDRTLKGYLFFVEG